MGVTPTHRIAVFSVSTKTDLSWNALIKTFQVSGKDSMGRIMKDTSMSFRNMMYQTGSVGSFSTMVSPFKYSFTNSFDLQRIARSGSSWADKQAAQKELDKREKK